jgi:hypothetical protein
VVQRRQRLRFAREARNTIAVMRNDVGQDLDGDITVELRVPRAIDLTHPACPERGDNFV